MGHRVPRMSTWVLRIEALSGRVCNFNKISAFTDGLKPAWLRGILPFCPLIYIYLYLNRLEELFLCVVVERAYKYIYKTVGKLRSDVETLYITDQPPPQTQQPCGLQAVRKWGQPYENNWTPQDSPVQ